MNFKKNFKRFFTLSRSAEGFTLVELIVVIAILGILTSVAVPAYSTYIKSAGESVDKQSLAVMNNALAVACAYAGVDPATGTAGLTMQWEGDKTFLGLSGTSTQTFALAQSEDATLEEKDDVVSLFNESLSLPIVFKSEAYNQYTVTLQNGVFVGPDTAFTPDENGNISVGYGNNGGKITMNVTDLNNLKDSTFIKNEDLGTQGMLDKVNDVTGFAAGMAGSDIMTGILSSPGFQQMAAGALGLENPDQDAFNAKFEELAKEMVDKYPNKYTGENALEDAKAQLQANAAVLYAAQNATNMNKSDITTMLSKENAGSDLLTNLKSDSAGTLSNAALAYGMYTAYAYSTGDQALIANTSNYTKMDEYLNDKNFRDWVGTEQGQKDLDAYLSALNMINSSAKDENAVSDLMVNGFNDPALVTLLNQAMGTN